MLYEVITDRLDGLTVTGLLQRSRQNLLYGVTTAEGHPAVLKTLSARQAEDPPLRQALWLEEWMLKRLDGNGCPEVLALPDRSALFYWHRRLPDQRPSPPLPSSDLLPPQAPNNARGSPERVVHFTSAYGQTR